MYVLCSSRNWKKNISIDKAGHEKRRGVVCLHGRWTGAGSEREHEWIPTVYVAFDEPKNCEETWKICDRYFKMCTLENGITEKKEKECDEM